MKYLRFTRAAFAATLFCLAGWTVQAEPEIDAKDLALVRQIRESILANPTKSGTGVSAYSEKISGTAVSFSMLPIPAGTFLIGSPASEKNRINPHDD